MDASVNSSASQRRQLEALDRDALAQLQLKKLNRLLKEVVPRNAFYHRKLSHVSQPLHSLKELSSWPVTTKEELTPLGGKQLPRHLTFSADNYVRYHQTSGTRGAPLWVLDTANDWKWWIECWQWVLDAAAVQAGDRAVLAFSFGPFIGFWSAFDALVARGAMAVPAGGLSSLARLELIRRTHAKVLLATPTYALRLAEVAAENNINLAHFSVETVIVAGEPGGSVPAFRTRIEEAWHAQVFDHAGASEVGPWGYPDAERRGLHVLESEFIAEFIALGSGHAAGDGELGELVLTTLGRDGSPLVRYRTGDLVRPRWPQDGANHFVLLEGGILGRVDDMLIIRGVNIFPSSIEQILHSFPEVVEYRITARRPHEMDELLVEVEDHLMQPERIAEELRIKLGLHVDVQCVPAMSLPRSEGKGKRFVDLRRR